MMEQFAAGGNYGSVKLSDSLGERPPPSWRAPRDGRT